MLAEVLPTGATNKSIAWSVTDVTGTATIVSTTGVLTGTGAGTVTAIATNVASGVTGTKDISVTAAPNSIAAPTPPKPLTPEEQASLDLSIGQQADLYGKDNIGFVKMLYDNILGRAAESEDLNGWVADLNNGMTGSQIAYYFIFSAELAPTVNSLSNNDFIAFLYKTLMNRPYDAEGYAGWQQQMESGMTREELVNNFVNSAEFAEICNLFNVAP